MDKLLRDRYEVREVLEAGELAEVRRAVDHRTGRQVAIRIIRPELIQDVPSRAKLRREAIAASMLDHPGIVAMHECDEDTVGGATVTYVVAEYVPGQSLATLLGDGRSLPTDWALEFTAELLEILEYAHGSGVIHGALRPSTVLLTADGDIKVADFGIGRIAEASSASVTDASALFDGARYLSPEQVTGGAVDARSDLYAIGCMLYELLTGRTPFTEGGALQVATDHVHTPPRPPSALRPGVSAAADTVVLTALAKDPAHRFASAEQMRAAIGQALTGEPVDEPDAGASSGTSLGASAGAGVTAVVPAPSDPAPSDTAPSDPAPSDTEPGYPEPSGPELTVPELSGRESPIPEQASPDPAPPDQGGSEAGAPAVGAGALVGGLGAGEADADEDEPARPRLAVNLVLASALVLVASLAFVTANLLSSYAQGPDTDEPTRPRVSESTTDSPGSPGRPTAPAGGARTSEPTTPADRDPTIESTPTATTPSATPTEIGAEPTGPTTQPTATSQPTSSPRPSDPPTSTSPPDPSPTTTTEPTPSPTETDPTPTDEPSPTDTVDPTSSPSEPAPDPTDE